MPPSIRSLSRFVAIATGVVTLAASIAAQDQITVVTNATVIEQPSGRAPRRHDRVVLHGGTIRCVGSTRQCAVQGDARMIDGRGKWVMPGLIDAHVHMSGPEVDAAGPLYLAFGITTVRDTGGHPNILRARLREFDSGQQVGPRIFMAARSLDGDPLKWAGDKSVPRQARTAEDVRAAVAEAKRDGASFIKLYGGLSRALLLEGIREAHRQGLKATADLLEWDDPGTLDELISEGLDGFEHLIPEHWGTWERDEARFRKIVPLLVRHKVAITWTLSLFARPASSRFPIDAPTFKALNPEQRRYAEEAWRSHVVTDVARKWYADVWPTAICNAMGMFHRAGGVSMVGTDSFWYCCFPGDLLEELQYMVACGLPPAAALAAATTNAATWLGAKDLGVIKAGGAADLLVLDANPLEDIANVRRIALVVSRGTVWKPTDLIARAQTKTPIR